ncbi:MAG: tetratricopeptide repeat protein [Proteobacteria bacterium]|nr:tetratricopeptide repeat protein [Pseudomonadota bacterium]MBI3498816.1 tetratricopeptide repeat protein [Pseudomonadota bacterium]
MTSSKFQAALALFRAGNLVPAAVVCRELLDAGTDLALASFLMGTIGVQIGEVAGSHLMFRRVIALEPGYAAAHGNLGLVAKTMGALAAAVRFYRRSIRIAPDDPPVLNNLGSLLHRLNQPEEAAAILRHAVRLQPDLAIAQQNLGTALTALGRAPEAMLAFRKALAARPDFAEAHCDLGLLNGNEGAMASAIAACRRSLTLDPLRAEPHAGLANCLRTLGRTTDAAASYRRGLVLDPGFAGLHACLGNLDAEICVFDTALRAYRRAVAIQPDFAVVHLGIHSVAQLIGDRPTALAHQRKALAIQRVFTEPCSRPEPQARILILYADGTWFANAPMEFILDRTKYTQHKYYMTAEAGEVPELPPYDVIFTAMGESDEAQSVLANAHRFIQSQSRPVINDPRRIAALSRDRVPDLLAGIGHCIVPRVHRLTGAQLARNGAALLGERGLAFPVVIRPVGSQAGENLSKLDHAPELDTYLAKQTATDFYVMPFVEYAGPDGYYRKYRIVFVDGRPFPYHLALSQSWMVHYYSSGMRVHDWMRDEEHKFLADIDQVFLPPLDKALLEIGRRIGLDYFGIDCAITPDGRLLVFEADVAIIVHLFDSIEMFPYKHRYVPLLFQAVERMIQSKIAADSSS